jgi:hypothetical protein
MAAPFRCAGSVLAGRAVVHRGLRAAAPPRPFGRFLAGRLGAPVGDQLVNRGRFALGWPDGGKLALQAADRR